jgi:hypothetical protein
MHFFGAALVRRGVQPTFIALNPELDKTRPQGGWGTVLSWIKKHPPASRSVQFFGQGLFGGALSQPSFDALIFQMDSDVVDDDSFRTHVQNNYGISFSSISDPAARGSIIYDLINSALGITTLTEVDARRHVVSVAVESTEAWCIAASFSTPLDVEAVRGQDLTNAFMKVLIQHEGQAPADNYSDCDKSFHRRERFCERHARFVDRVSQSASHFNKARLHLESLV